MKKRIAINGFGRIGRLIFRQIYNNPDYEVVVINDLTSPANLAYLLKYDSSQGRFLDNKISSSNNSIIVNNKEIKITEIRNPKDLPWKAENIDLVIESTGLFLTKELASLHLEAGAKKVILSAPTKSEGIRTVVYGINHNEITPEERIISGASCTTNCLALPLHAIHQKYEILGGWTSTIHSSTNDQRVLDLPHADYRRGRSALVNIIPTSSGAAVAIGKVIPSLKGKLDCVSFRVPTVTGSIVDTALELNTKVSVEEINNYLREYTKTLKHFASTSDPIVSSDVIGSKYGSIVDLSFTKIVNYGEKQLVKIVSWYDNENSYVSQFVRTLGHFINV